MKKHNAWERSEETRDGFEACQAISLTLLKDASLPERLLTEVGFALDRIKLRWPEFKRAPAAFVFTELHELKRALKQALTAPHRIDALFTALLVVGAVTIGVFLLERHAANHKVADVSDEFEVVSILNLGDSTNSSSDPGVGAGERGRVGFEKGSGEGSRPQPARAHGGGGGGTHAQLPASQGRVPLPSIIPAPIPTAVVRLPQALPVAGIDLDPALWRKLDYPSYGDPRSKETTASNGPGDGGGVGTGNGTGIGEGDRSGFGPGRDGNMGGDGKELGGRGKGGSRGNNPDGDEPDHVYKSPEVSTRPRVITKPEPTYTEEARRNQVTGTVLLRVVFSSSGQVTNIQAVQKLSGGLTEKAIAAARQIRFVPATRNGQPVSMQMQLEYNFNLY